MGPEGGPSPAEHPGNTQQEVVNNALAAFEKTLNSLRQGARTERAGQPKSSLENNTNTEIAPADNGNEWLGEKPAPVSSVDLTFWKNRLPKASYENFVARTSRQEAEQGLPSPEQPNPWAVKIIRPNGDVVQFRTVREYQLAVGESATAPRPGSLAPSAPEESSVGVGVAPKPEIASSAASVNVEASTSASENPQPALSEAAQQPEKINLSVEDLKRQLEQVIDLLKTRQETQHTPRLGDRVRNLYNRLLGRGKQTEAQKVVNRYTEVSQYAQELEKQAREVLVLAVEKTIEALTALEKLPHLNRRLHQVTEAIRQGESLRNIRQLEAGRIDKIEKLLNALSGEKSSIKVELNKVREQFRVAAEAARSILEAYTAESTTDPKLIQAASLISNRLRAAEARIATSETPSSSVAQSEPIPTGSNATVLPITGTESQPLGRAA